MKQESIEYLMMGLKWLETLDNNDINKNIGNIKKENLEEISYKNIYINIVNIITELKWTNNISDSDEAKKYPEPGATNKSHAIAMAELNFKYIGRLEEGNYASFEKSDYFTEASSRSANIYRELNEKANEINNHAELFFYQLNNQADSESENDNFI
ncbi:hypothetical protein L3V79_08850 [Thiotrichales bacterium 19S9-12]|nr:hypothetical protein [Thiotrichales bacterium 19S9-11]MCF6812464.1 hypothetical protein [Thiotrichales bacterium 19S9-12]